MGYASVMQRRHSAGSSAGGRFASGADSMPAQTTVTSGALTLERSDSPANGSPLAADDYPLICDSCEYARVECPDDYEEPIDQGDDRCSFCGEELAEPVIDTNVD